MTPSSPAPIVVAGATGTVGARVLAGLLARGTRVRAVVRDPSRIAPHPLVETIALSGPDLVDEAAWGRVLEGSQAVVSALGASVALNARGRASYLDVDVPVHRALAAAARAAGVRAGAYVSVHPAPGYDQTRYVQAHLEVERILGASLPALGVVRPTGIYSALEDLVDMAARGMGLVIGDGQARTNPVHPDDVSAAVLRALDDALAATSSTTAVGGPEVMTRAAIVEAAFAAVGRRPRLLHVPAAVFEVYGALLRPFHPRLGDLVAFFVAVSTHDGIAPAVGTKTLRDHFAARRLPKRTDKNALSAPTR